LKSIESTLRAESNDPRVRSRKLSCRIKTGSLSISSSMSRNEGFRKMDWRCIRSSTEILGRRFLRGGGDNGVMSSDCERKRDDVRGFVRRGGGGKLIMIGGDGGCGAMGR